MRVLLDHDVPHQLRLALPSHEVATARYRGWDRARNGELLALADGEFDALVTADKDYRDDPDLRRRVAGLTAVGVVLLEGRIRRETVLARAAEIDRALRQIEPGRLVEVRVTEREGPSRAESPDRDPRGRDR